MIDETFSQMVGHQLELQREAFHLDPTTMTDEERIEFIHWNFTALADELHEMLGEVGWKPWASSRHVNEGAAIGEMVDAWHFFANILLALFQAKPEDIADEFCRRYRLKREINLGRQVDGYDGVSSKCPSCKREITEAGIEEYRNVERMLVVRMCAGCGNLLGRYTYEELHYS